MVNRRAVDEVVECGDVLYSFREVVYESYQVSLEALHSSLLFTILVIFKINQLATELRGMSSFL